MEAEIITYETKRLSNSQRSIISKKIFGYTDRTKGSKYTYIRPGILETSPYIKITKKTLIIPATHSKHVKSILTQLGATIKSWKISIKKATLHKR